MNRRERAQCEEWEQLIIDGVAVHQLPDFNAELILSYWQAEGFRPAALGPLKAQYSAWASARSGRN